MSGQVGGAYGIQQDFCGVVQDVRISVVNAEKPAHITNAVSTCPLNPRLRTDNHRVSGLSKTSECVSLCGNEFRDCTGSSEEELGGCTHR